jgi:TetR/AcrR family transcriptional regulator, cholesterol catabolism regulator
MEVKERIKHKADELYRRYGIKSVTMDEIASQLGVSKKTIYHSFSDKNELVDAVIVDMLDHNRECCQVDHKRSQNAIHEVYLAMEMLQEMFDNMNPSILFDIERNYPATFAKFTEYKYNFLFKMVKENIERGKKEELYRPEVNMDVAAKMRLETMLLPFDEELFPKNKFSLVTVQQQLIEYFLFGIASMKGYKLITKYQKERFDSYQ